MLLSNRIQKVLAATLVLSSFVTAADLLTPKHEAGRCAIRGNCGKKSFFGKELPCLDNGLAKEPEDTLREKLVGLCGDQWKEGPVCCEEVQVSTLTSLESNNHIEDMLMIYRSMRLAQILRRRNQSFLPALPARPTSTTSFAHLPALPTSPFS
jgi:Niemann-Pick C1 N terminus